MPILIKSKGLFFMRLSFLFALLITGCNSANLSVSMASLLDDSPIIYHFYVREDCTAAPTPCYMTLAGFQSNAVADSALVTQDLVAQNSKIYVHIQNAWLAGDTTNVSLDGWTTDSDHFIIIQTEGAARHNGTVAGNEYKLTPTFVAGPQLRVRADYTVIDGLTFSSGALSGGNNIRVEADQVIIRNVIIHDSTGDYATAIEFEEAGGTLTVESALIYNIGWNGISIWLAGPESNITLNIFNSTLHNVCLGNTGIIWSEFRSGIGGSKNGVCTNCFINIINTISHCADSNVVGGGLDYDIGNGAASGPLSSNNVSFDATVVGANGTANALFTDIPPGVDPITPTVVYTSLTPGSENFHLVSNTWNFAQIGGAVDLSLYFTTDIDDEVIGVWQLGADNTP